MPACDRASPPAGAASHALSLAEALGAEQSRVLWSRTKTTDARGRERVEVVQTEDPALLARMEEITAEDFFDPDVEVVLEDFADGTEDGASVSGTVLRLQPRLYDGEGDEGAVMAAAKRLPSAERRPVRERPAHREATTEELLAEDERAAADAGEDLSNFVVLLAPEPATEVPPQHTSPIELTALEKLDWRLARLEAMAARGEEVVELQQPFVDWLMEQGGQVVSQHWIDNRVFVRAPAVLLREIAGRPDVTQVRRVGDIRPDGVFDRSVVREGIQAQAFLDAGYDGQRTSSRNAHGIWLGIIEAGLDEAGNDADGLTKNVVGFNDGVGPTSRVFSTWDCDAPAACDTTLDPCTGQHGMWVASVAVADFTDGQNPLLAQAERPKRSGIALEGSIALTSYSGAGASGITLAVEKAMADNLDIVNHSGGGNDGSCDPVDPTATPINSAYSDGILWINSLGNGTNCNPDPICNANDQSAAYGSVAVAAHDSFDDGSYDDALLCGAGSSDGRADWGDVADIAAPGGVYAPMDCVNTFRPDTGSCDGTSFAAPHVSGSAALLMDHWIATFSDASAHQPGRMHALLLAMGDGCGTRNGLDGRWGAGRLRLRKFDSAGLDAPYSARAYSTTLVDGDEQTVFHVYTDANGQDLPLPATVDALVATAFCKELNPSTANLTVSLDLYDVDRGAVVSFQDQLGEKTRITMSPEAHRYWLQVAARNIPWPTQIPCHVIMLFEDSARNDADGPPATIEPYHVWDPFFQGGGPDVPDCFGAC